MELCCVVELLFGRNRDYPGVVAYVAPSSFRFQGENL